MKIASLFRNSYATLALSVVLLAVNPVHASIYSELDDAGITVETVEYLPAGTTTIFGALHDDDGADVYSFVWGGGIFSANTFGSNFDTMLSIFNLEGTLLAFNDEYAESGSVSLVSSELNPGEYLLGITYYDNNYNGDINSYLNFGIETPYQVNITTASEATGLPEPMPLLLIAIGLVGLAFDRRKNSFRVGSSTRVHLR